MTEQSSLVVRKFELKDIDQVMEINKNTLPENYPESFFRTIYSELPSAFLIVEVNGELIGYTMARIERGLSHYSIFHRAKKGHTVSIAIKPKYRKKGFATKLLTESMTAMIKQGVNELFLEVRASNDAAVNLYKSAGFEILKEIKHYYRDFEAAYLMVKKVTKSSNQTT